MDLLYLHGSRISYHVSDFTFYVKFNITHTQFPVELGEWQRERKMSVTISIEYMKKFLAELGRLFPEKKSFLGIVLKTVAQILEFRSNVKKDLVWGNNCVIVYNL